MSDIWSIARTRLRPDSKTIAVIAPTIERARVEMRTMYAKAPECRIHQAAMTAHLGQWQVLFCSGTSPERLHGTSLSDAVESAEHALEIIREESGGG